MHRNKTIEGGDGDSTCHGLVPRARFIKPEVTSETEYCFVNGNTALMQCQIAGKVEKVSWKKRKETDDAFCDIRIDNKKYFGGSVSSPSLVIASVGGDDAGTYVCRATNDVGEGETGEIEVTIKDNVQDNDTTDRDPKTLQQNMEEISCAAKAEAQKYVAAFGKIHELSFRCGPDVRDISVKFIIDDEVTPDSNFKNRLQHLISKVLNVPYGRIRIEITKHCIIVSFDNVGASIPWEMSALWLAERFRSVLADGSICLTDGQGNPLSIREDSTEIFNVSSENPDSSDIPRVSLEEDCFMEAVGGISILKCAALSSSPIISVKWFLIKKEQETEYEVNIDNKKYYGGSVESPSLAINNTDHSDQGLYICRAENKHGTRDSKPGLLFIFNNVRQVLIGSRQEYMEAGQDISSDDHETIEIAQKSMVVKQESMDAKQDSTEAKQESLEAKQESMMIAKQKTMETMSDSMESKRYTTDTMSANMDRLRMKIRPKYGLSHSTAQETSMSKDVIRFKDDGPTHHPPTGDLNPRPPHLQPELEKVHPNLFPQDIESAVAIVKKGDIEQFELLTKRLKTLEMEGSAVLSILHVVALYGSPEMTECIAKHQDTKWDSGYNVREYLFGIDVPQLREGTFTALYIATFLERTDIVHSMIKYSSEENIDFCFKTLHNNKQIEEIFMLNQAEKLKLKYSHLQPNVIPGHRLEKDGGRTPVYIVYSVHENHMSSYELRSLGMVILRNPYAYNKEWKDVSNDAKTVSCEDRERAKKILSRYQQSLLMEHSNLNIIHVTHVRYQNNGEDIVEKPCIALYCSTKGVVPLGEPEFPKRLDTGDGDYMEVDVHEGHFIPDVYHSLPSSHLHPDLKMGCNIGRSTNEYDASGNLLRFIGGTLGPFVKFNNKIGFITCAHVLFDIPDQDRFIYHYDGTNLVEVVQPSRDSSVFGGAPCGHVVVAIFDPTLDPSVDVAVVELTDQSRVPAKGRFANENHSSYLDAGFAELPEYNSGSKQEDLKEFATNHIVYKFGSASDVTKGTLDVSGISARTLTTALGLPRSGRDVTMKNQYKVTGCSPTWSFFTNGDSGSGVFMKKSGTGELVLVGMGIGDAYLSTSPVPVGVVTPIGSILNALGPQFSIASFP